MKLITFNGASDYNKINHLPFNRKFCVRTDLMQKMNTYGFTCPIFLIETSLIDGKKKKWLVDGQHRAVTAAFLNIPFTGIVLDIPFKSIEMYSTENAGIIDVTKTKRYMRGEFRWSLRVKLCLVFIGHQRHELERPRFMSK
jgi:hypothetical protein